MKPNSGLLDVLGKHPSEIAFLAGAGISKPPPSMLPDASELISVLVEAITNDLHLRTLILERLFSADANRRFPGDFLRFEAVMGLIGQAIDPEMRILRIYSNCIHPNRYHFFLAEQLEQGAAVLTTNFDNLIEIACRARGTQYSLVVSDEELAAFCLAPETFRNPLIKLHGGFDLLDSQGGRQCGARNVKATLEKIGRTYLNSGPDQSCAAIAGVLKTRHLIVMGYSGCDDFDIMPRMMMEYPVKGFTWIDHCEQSTKVFLKPEAKQLDLPPYRMLAKQVSGRLDVRVVRGDTAAILGICMDQLAATEAFDWICAFTAWSQEYIASDAHKRLLLGEMLCQIERLEESMVLLESISRKLLTIRQWVVRCFMLSNLYGVLGDHERAIVNLAEMADIEEEIDGLSPKGYAYYNLARINSDMEQYVVAELYLHSAMRVFMQLGDGARVGDCLHERGRILLGTGAADEAIKLFESAIEYSKATGDLSGTAIGFTEIARALGDQGKSKDAEEYARKAIDVLELHGSQSGLGRARHALGYALAMRGDYAEAACEFEAAIEYERVVGGTLDVAHSLHCLGHMYLRMDDVDRAKRCLQESVGIKRTIQDEKGIANSGLLLEEIRHIEAQRFA